MGEGCGWPSDDPMSDLPEDNSLGPETVSETPGAWTAAGWSEATNLSPTAPRTRTAPIPAIVPMIRFEDIANIPYLSPINSSPWKARNSWQVEV